MLNRKISLIRQSTDSRYKSANYRLLFMITNQAYKKPAYAGYVHLLVWYSACKYKCRTHVISSDTKVTSFFVKLTAVLMDPEF